MEKIKIGDGIKNYFQIVGEGSRRKPWKTMPIEKFWILRYEWGEEREVRKDHVLRMLKTNYKMPNLGRHESALRSIRRSYKAAAKRRGIFWDLSDEQVWNLIVSKCYYCNSEPSNSEEHTGMKYSGIDRIDSNLGYELTNCVPSCWICNRAKKDLSMKEFDLWVGRLVRSSLGRL